MPDPTARWPALISARYDFSWFVLPGVLALAWALCIGQRPASGADENASLTLWIAGVLLVDVAHVYASLYRTYLDPQARKLHRTRLVWAPLLCGWFGFLLHLESALLFWSVLAYIAIFHFIKQHIGFALLYARAGRESAFDRRLLTWALWAGTGAPVVYWHAHLPTQFAWFMQGDLIGGIPAGIGELALWLEIPLLLVFIARRIQLAARGAPNPMLPLLVIVPTLSWHVGIVWFNDDRIFTITNVFLHGVPYFALVWATGGRDRVAAVLRANRSRRVPLLAIAFYLALVALAVGEETLWDRLVWHDREVLFGVGTTRLHGLGEAFVVALLTIPQATHYILDRYIWRAGPQNPKLAAALGFDR